jgi:hypothetical protein
VKAARGGAPLLRSCTSLGGGRPGWCSCGARRSWPLAAPNYDTCFGSQVTYTTAVQIRRRPAPSPAAARPGRPTRSSCRRKRTNPGTRTARAPTQRCTPPPLRCSTAPRAARRPAPARPASALAALPAGRAAFRGAAASRRFRPAGLSGAARRRPVSVLPWGRGGSGFAFLGARDG